jgi:hypothetical protein
MKLVSYAADKAVPKTSQVPCSSACPGRHALIILHGAQPLRGTAFVSRELRRSHQSPREATQAPRADWLGLVNSQSRFVLVWGGTRFKCQEHAPRQIATARENGRTRWEKRRRCLLDGNGAYDSATVCPAASVGRIVYTDRPQQSAFSQLASNPILFRIIIVSYCRLICPQSSDH